jgi:hypothetical protein
MTEWLKMKSSVARNISEKESPAFRHGENIKFGLNTTYEAYGILEVAKQDLQKEEY